MRSFLLVTLLTVIGCATQKAGILVMAHGGDAAWNQDVEAVVAPIQSRYPLEVAYGMATTSTLRQAVERLETQGVERIAVVRLFISGDSFLAPTEYILGLRDTCPPTAHADAQVQRASHDPAASEPPAAQATNGHEQHGAHETHRHEQDSAPQTHASHHAMEPPQPINTRCSIVLSRSGVGESPLVDEILHDRVKALSTDPSRESVLILAHGPADEAENERWLANMRLRAQRIHDIGPFRHVQCETLREDWPQRRAEAEQRIRQYVELASRDGGRVIVIPFRIAGFGPYEDVLAGLDYTSDGRGFCPHPNLTRWIEATAHACLAETTVGKP